MTSPGILISSGSQPIIRRNRVFGSHAAGIEVTNGGGGEIHGNEIFDNRFEGICLATGVKPTVSGELLWMKKISNLHSSKKFTFSRFVNFLSVES